MDAIESLVPTVQISPSPNETHPAVQVLLGLGQSGAMLVGFLLLVAVMIGTMLFMGWAAHREPGQNSASP